MTYSSTTLGVHGISREDPSSRIGIPGGRKPGSPLPMRHIRPELHADTAVLVTYSALKKNITYIEHQYAVVRCTQQAHTWYDPLLLYYSCFALLGTAAFSHRVACISQKKKRKNVLKSLSILKSRKTSFLVGAAVEVLQSFCSVLLTANTRFDGKRRMSAPPGAQTSD